MTIRKIGVTFCALLAVGMMAFAVDKEFKATCPVSGKPALEDKSVDYKGGKVYFCCGNCPGAFTKDTAKFSTKANLQLAQTGQATEIKCPFSGGKLNPDTAIEISGVKVAFCCEKCQGKAAAAKGDEQIDLVFKDAAFDKGYEVPKK